MKNFAFALLLGAAFIASPAMANNEDQFNTHGHYSYYKSDRGYSDIMRLDRTMVADIQRELHNLGYNPGKVDGILGKQTRGALKRYQHDNYLQGNGEITERTLKSLDLPGAPKRYHRRSSSYQHRYN